MAENSKIEWCDHTFNPWVGCTKVSPACDHCYAEGWAKRTGQANLWAGDRRRTSEANWRLPLKWNRQAEREGRRFRVFCASLADVFDNQVPPEWRRDLWDLIGKTRHLDWLLLTKRPQNIAKMLPAEDSRDPMYRPWTQKWPWPNVWLGTTVENQEEADRRIPHLLAVPAAVHFLSCEPLLGPVEFEDWWLRAPTDCESCDGDGLGGRSLQWCPRGACPHDEGIGRIDWVIAGGESGPGARPSHPDWFRSLRDQCASAYVPFHFKQHGDLLVGEDTTESHPLHQATLFQDGDTFMVVSDGHDIVLGTAYDHRGAPRKIWGEYWASGDGHLAKRVGKKAAGRLLDGIEHNGLPPRG